MFRFEGLEIWQLAFQYAGKLYGLTSGFPKSEQFVLTEQLRRAGLSIPTNIAEGSGGTNREFSQYVSIAIRSALETVSLLKFARQREYVSEGDTASLYEEAERFVRKARRFQHSLRGSEPTTRDTPLAICDPTPSSSLV